MRTCCSNDATACSTAPENLYGWAPHHQSPALAASLALSRFLYATELLISVVFPHGPLLEGASPGDLTTQQHPVCSASATFPKGASWARRSGRSCDGASL
jgi:hypothetical protein